MNPLALVKQNSTSINKCPCWVGKHYHLHFAEEETRVQGFELD